MEQTEGLSTKTTESEHSITPPAQGESGWSVIMRYAGIAMAGMGALVLLLEGAIRVDPVGRFFSFSLIICLSAVLGVYLSWVRSDRRNGRALVGIFLACVPVFWAQLGAVLYAGFQGVAEQVPLWLRMPVPSSTMLGLAMFCAVAGVIPLSAFAARVFASGWARQCSIMLSLLGVALALPVRTGTVAVFILTTITVAVSLHERLFLPRGALRFTGDTLLVRMILILLPLTAVGRALQYGSSEAVFSAMLIASGTAIFWLGQVINRSNSWMSEYLSDIFHAFGTTVFVQYLIASAGFGHTGKYTLVIAGAYMLVRTLISHPRESGVWLFTSHTLLLLGSLPLAGNESVLAQLLGFGIPVGLSIFLYAHRHPTMLLFSVLIMITNLQHILSELLSRIVEYRWSILMISGIGLIFGASYVEKGFHRIARHWKSGASRME